MYIHRLAETILNNALKTNKVLIILGARQVGKTTLVKHFLSGQKITFLNFDIEVDKQKFISSGHLAPSDVPSFFNSPEYLVIDEAQRLSETSEIIKGWYDFGVPFKIILLGSSSLELINQTGESLAGRNQKIFLPPFLFSETLSNASWYHPLLPPQQLNEDFSEQINSTLLRSLVYGGYPEAITSPDPENYLLNLTTDYLLKDVLQLGLVKAPETIKKLLLLLAHQVGSEVSISELSNALGIARTTIERYLQLLEQTFVIFRLPAFSNNPRKEITKSQKIFFYDSGIRNALLKEFSFSPTRSDIGLLWENFVISEFAKHNLLTGQKQNLYFWRSRGNSEVDLIIKENGTIKAYEIKWQTKKINKEAFENLYHTKVELITSEHPPILGL